MVGYAKQSTGDTYRMFNLGTNKVTNTRDVKWTNKLYDKGFNSSKEQSDYYTASEEDTDEDSEFDIQYGDDDDANDNEDEKQEIVHRLMRENDDKTSSLKLATAEIVDLRRAMKLM